MAAVQHFQINFFFFLKESAAGNLTPAIFNLGQKTISFTPKDGFTDGLSML